MNSVAHDSELLTHHVAAVAVPGSMRFIAVRDENNLLMIFSIGTDSKIYVSKINQSGQRIVCDFGQMLGLSDKYRGHAIDVTQDPASSTLFIAVATSLLSGDGSAMYILRPFRPSEADLGSPITRLTDFIIPESGGRVNPRIFSIYMASKVMSKMSWKCQLICMQLNRASRRPKLAIPRFSSLTRRKSTSRRISIEQTLLATPITSGSGLVETMSCCPKMLQGFSLYRRLPFA